MNRRELGDLVKLKMGFNNSDARVDDRVVWRIADMILGQLILDYIKEFGLETKGEFIKGKVFEVQADTIRNAKYVEIGSKILNLPNNGGFASVSLTQGYTEPFTLTSVGQRGIYNLLEANDIGTTYWQEGSRIYFDELGFEVTEVLVICIPSISILTDTEDIPMPFGTQGKLLDIVSRELMGQMPEDKTGDARQTTQ